MKKNAQFTEKLYIDYLTDDTVSSMTEYSNKHKIDNRKFSYYKQHYYEYLFREIPNSEEKIRDEFSNFGNNVTKFIKYFNLNSSHNSKKLYDVMLPSDKMSNLYVENNYSFEEIANVIDFPIITPEIVAERIMNNLKLHRSEKNKSTNLSRAVKGYYHDSGAGILATKFTATAYVKDKELAYKLVKDQKMLVKFLNDFKISHAGYDRGFTLTDISRIIGIQPVSLSSSFGIRPDGVTIINGRSCLEDDIYKFVKSNYTGIILKNTFPFGKQQGQLDIYLPEMNFAIEVNGFYFHSTSEGAGRVVTQNYHKRKKEFFNSKGIDLFFIWDFDLLNQYKYEIIKSQLLYKLHSSKIEHVGARKLILGSPTRKEAVDFFNLNHIQGGDSVGSIIYGLKDKSGDYISMMSFGKRFNNRYDYELIRFANKKLTSVSGAGSRLYKEFKKNYHGLIVSYASGDFAHRIDNSLYHILGFDYKGSSKPGYFWVYRYLYNSDNYKDNVINRYRVQPKRLLQEGKRFSRDTDTFRKYNKKETETEYMERHNYLKVYNAGNGIFVDKV